MIPSAKSWPPFVANLKCQTASFGSTQKDVLACESNSQDLFVKQSPQIESGRGLFRGIALRFLDK